MKRELILLPAAIIFAGVIIAISIYTLRTNNVFTEPTGDLSLMRPVTPEEHVIGNPDAAVTIVTYSDIECPYCKQFQRTMTQLMAEYASTGDVAWVYRHLPLVHLHPNAGEHAEASECATLLGEADAFWRFIDAIHALAPNTTEFNPEAYIALLPQLRISQADFEACMSEGRFVKKVEADLENALEIGAAATPFSVVLIDGQEPLQITGALPYTAMREVIETMLEKAGR